MQIMKNNQSSNSVPILERVKVSLSVIVRYSDVSPAPSKEIKPARAQDFWHSPASIIPTSNLFRRSVILCFALEKLIY